MTTTGTTAFNLDVNTLIEESYERCGAEMRTGYDLRTARRSLNLMLMDWANRGVNLWTIEEGSIPLVAGTAEYDLPLDTVDLLDFVVRTSSGLNQSDMVISRVSFSTYSTVPNKNTPGRPVQVWVRRLSGATTPGGVAYPSVTFYPVPDQTSYYTFVYWRLKRMDDVGSGTGTLDIPFRFMPAMVAGLAYHLALKLPNALPRVEMLKAMYDEQWDMASNEDRERATLRIVPRIGR